jgi:DNA-binding transcriptional LysR family regulator
MTDEGSRYYSGSMEILRLVEQVGEETRETRGAPSGVVRLSCTAAFGVLHVSRLIFAFQDRFPDINIDLSLTDERIDLVREGIDITLRLGPLMDSSLKLRMLGKSQRMLVAAPDYLAARGRPLIPEDLSAHEGIRMSNIAGSDTLDLTGPAGSAIRCRSGASPHRPWSRGARSPCGGTRHCTRHQWLIDDLLTAGRLERVLPGYALPHVPLSMLIVPERTGIARVRLLAGFIAEQISGIPGFNQSSQEH